MDNDSSSLKGAEAGKAAVQRLLKQPEYRKLMTNLKDRDGAPPIVYSVKSLEAFPVERSSGSMAGKKGTVYLIECPMECPRSHPQSVLGTVIEIDGVTHKIHAVERHMPATPIRQGEKIGIWTYPDTEA